MPTEPINSLYADEPQRRPDGESPAAPQHHYDHSRKAGNQADLVKHALLLAAVSRVTHHHRPLPFVYAESHAGAARHPLEHGGAWEAGVGAFGRRLTGSDGTDSRWPALRPYTATALDTPPRAGMTYAGSHALVQRLLTRAGRPLRMYLWDTCPRVCSDLRLRYRAAASVHVCRGDGYRGVARLPRADLMLIDPPALNPRLVARAVAGLSLRSMRFLCWIPRTGTAGGGEDPLTRQFLELVAADHYVGTAQWRDWNEGLCGCAVVASSDLEGPLSAAFLELLWAMGWRP